MLEFLVGFPFVIILLVYFRKKSIYTYFFSNEDNPDNAFIIEKITQEVGPYQAPWWFSAIFAVHEYRIPPSIAYYREIFIHKTNASFCVDWNSPRTITNNMNNKNKPLHEIISTSGASFLKVVVHLPGLGGHSRKTACEKYVTSLTDAGYITGVLNQRGNTHPLTSPETWNAALIDDLALLVNDIVDAVNTTNDKRLRDGNENEMKVYLFLSAVSASTNILKKFLLNLSMGDKNNSNKNCKNNGLFGWKDVSANNNSSDCEQNSNKSMDVSGVCMPIRLPFGFDIFEKLRRNINFSNNNDDRNNNNNHNRSNHNNDKTNNYSKGGVYLMGAFACCVCYDYKSNRKRMESTFIGKKTSAILAKQYKKLILDSCSNDVQLHSFFNKELLDQIQSAKLISDFDKVVSTQLWGYRNESEFCNDLSNHDLHHLQYPYLILQPADDPIYGNEVRQHIPVHEYLKSNHIIYMETSHGGHNAFYEGTLLGHLLRIDRWNRGSHTYPARVGVKFFDSLLQLSLEKSK